MLLAPTPILEESLSPTTEIAKAPIAQWRGRKLAKRVWICNSGMKFLFHVTADQATMLLAQRTVKEIVEPQQPGAIWRVMLTRTPGPIAKPCHVPTMRDFCTPPSVIFKRNTRVIAAVGTYEFDENKFQDGDRWAYVLSVTDNIKQVSITRS